MQSNLDKSESPNEFLSSFWVSQVDKFNKMNLFDDIKKRLSKSDREVVKLSELMLKFSEVYNAVRNTKDDYWQDYDPIVRQKISDLKIIKAKAITPILMVAAIKFSKEEFRKLLNYLVVIQVRYILICEEGTQKYSAELTKIPRKIHDGDLVKARKVFDHLNAAGLYMSDEDFKKAFAEISISDTKKVKYLLSEIEHYMSGADRVVNPNGSIVNIEHLIPKNESQNWTKKITKIEPDEYSKQVNRLGNLFLTNAKINGKMKQYDFLTKQEILFSIPCEFETTKTLKNADLWNIDKIKERQAELARIAVSTWRI